MKVRYGELKKRGKVSVIIAVFLSVVLLSGIVLGVLTQGFKNWDSESWFVVSPVNSNDSDALKGDKGEKGDKGDKGDTGATGPQGEKGEKGDKGDTGANGIDGQDGITPHIGENGNWFIGTVDTGIQAEGIDGKDGKDGKDGVDGKDGKDGVDGINGLDGSGFSNLVYDTGIVKAPVMLSITYANEMLFEYELYELIYEASEWSPAEYMFLQKFSAIDYSYSNCIDFKTAEFSCIQLNTMYETTVSGFPAVQMDIEGMHPNDTSANRARFYFRLRILENFYLREDGGEQSSGGGQDDEFVLVEFYDTGIMPESLSMPNEFTISKDMILVYSLYFMTYVNGHYEYEFLSETTHETFINSLAFTFENGWANYDYYDNYKCFSLSGSFGRNPDNFALQLKILKQDKKPQANNGITNIYSALEAEHNIYLGTTEDLANSSAVYLIEFMSYNYWDLSYSFTISSLMLAKNFSSHYYRNYGVEGEDYCVHKKVEFDSQDCSRYCLEIRDNERGELFLYVHETQWINEVNSGNPNTSYLLSYVSVTKLGG